LQHLGGHGQAQQTQGQQGEDARGKKTELECKHHDKKDLKIQFLT
jgi:hypothetical protein